MKYSLKRTPNFGDDKVYFLLFYIDYLWNPPLVRYGIRAIREIAKGMKVSEQKILNIEPYRKI